MYGHATIVARAAPHISIHCQGAPCRFRGWGFANHEDDVVAVELLHAVKVLRMLLPKPTDSHHPLPSPCEVLVPSPSASRSSCRHVNRLGRRALPSLSLAMDHGAVPTLSAQSSAPRTSFWTPTMTTDMGSVEDSTMASMVWLMSVIICQNNATRELEELRMTSRAEGL